MAAVSKAEELRGDGAEVSVYVRPKKMGKFLNCLQEQVFGAFLALGESEEPRPLAQ